MVTMNDIQDIFDIDKNIESINNQRKQLSSKLTNNEKLIQILSEQTPNFKSIADDLIENIHQLSDVDHFKQKYGELQILDIIESKLIEKLAYNSNIKELKQVENDIDEIIASDLGKTSYANLSVIHNNIKNILSEGHITENEPVLQAIFNKFDQLLLSPFCEREYECLNQLLLNSKWDTNKFLLSDNTSLNSLRSRSSNLFKLDLLYLQKENRQFWTFKSLATNFQIRFTYHFHNSNSKDIAVYFKFLNDYLNANLNKCITLFQNNDVGLTKELLHKEFINHILQPMRDRINNTLSNNNLNSLITLISQIIYTDKNLIKTFHYNGNGLVSLISDKFWDIWINYEIKTIINQYHVITENPKDLIKSGYNFIKLLDKVYDYFKPFYELDFEPLLKYKLQTCSEIYLDLSSRYMDYILTTNSLPDKYSKEEELYQTISKLELFNIVYNKLNELSNQSIFIKLTQTVNKTESKEYISVFQDILSNYRENMLMDLQKAIIHRIQKLLKDSLQTYFKIGMWTLNELTEEAIRPEMTNTVNMLRQIITKLENSDIPPAILFNIKNELLNIMINYFIESILKLNKFNRMGIYQLKIDFKSVKETLNLLCDFQNKQEIIFSEIMSIIDLKYNDEYVEFANSSYIKKGDFNQLRKRLHIMQLTDNDIQDALFRIAYGNII